jgi:hypothetical protein
LESRLTFDRLSSGKTAPKEEFLFSDIFEIRSPKAEIRNSHGMGLVLIEIVV